MATTSRLQPPGQLLALPTHLFAFLQASHHSPPRKADILSLLQHDPALTSIVLGHTPSTCLPGLCEPDTEALSQWLDALSSDQLRQAALIACSPWLANPDTDATLLQLHAMHRQAVRVSSLMGQMANLLEHTANDEARLAGLLHNLGKLALLSSHAERFTESGITPEAVQDSLQAELDLFGENHLTLATDLISSWQLDSFLTDAIANQYEDLQEEADSPVLFHLLQAAREVCRHGADKAPVPRVLSSVGVTEQSWQSALSLWEEALAGHPWMARDDAAVVQAERRALQQLQGWLATLGITQSRQIALLRSPDQLTLLQTCAAILTEELASQVLFFLVSDDQRSLQGMPLPGQPQRLAQLQARIESGTSLVAQALVSDDTLDSFSAETFALGMLDRQLLSLVNTQGYYCLPLTLHGESLGTVVLAVDSAEQLDATDAALQSLLHTLAEKLLALKSAPQDDNQREENALLAREIYHEVSSPVSAIRNYLYVLKRDASEEARETLQQVENETSRISEILLNFRQRAVSEMQTNEVLDINALIRETVNRVVKQLTFKGQLETTLDASAPRLNSNRTALQQIVTNLLSNAMEATLSEGHISVTTRAGWVINQQRFLCIEIEDNGGGISKDIQQRLFQPVTSTKGGQHAGLGLNIVNKLVHDLHGSISVRTDENGTCFQVFLPETRPQ